MLRDFDRGGDVEGRELVVGGFGCPESSRSWPVRSRVPPFRTERERVGHPFFWG